MGEGLLSKLFAGDKPAPSQSIVTDQLKNQIVIDTISDGIAIIDAHGIIQLFNPAASSLTGWQTSDAINLDYRSIFVLYNNAGQEVAASDNPILVALSTGKRASSDTVYLSTVSKRRIQVSLKAAPIIDNARMNSAPTIVGVVVVFRDITRERAEQNAQTDFISTASHEMRTPVATIEGYLGMILNPNICTIDDRAREYATKSHDAIRHLGRLFQDLLDVTKADDNRVNLQPTLIDAAIASRQVTESLMAKAQTKGLTLSFSDGSSPNSSGNRVVTPPSIIYVDLDHFEEVLGNMIENAIKYTKQGGIVVSIANNAGRARISVTDTGIGIPAEDLKHLFQKFYRVDNSETREIGGTGLGLYLIKKLTTQMGGTVGVDSVYGKGSTFWIEFDVLNREQAIQRAREIKARQDSSSNSNTTTAGKEVA